MSLSASYLSQLCLLLISALLIVGACNGLVDPYAVYDSPRVVGWNAIKVSYEDRLHKAARIARLQPDAVLLGSSRVQYGLDPEDPALAGLAERVYNVGLLGAGPYQLRRYLEHAHALSPVRLAVIGLDFLMWDQRLSKAGFAAAFDEDRLAVDARGQRSATWFAADLGATLLSFDALRLSLATLRQQRSAIDELLPNGMRNPADIAKRAREHGGIHAHFVHSERMYAHEYRRLRAQDASAMAHAYDELDRMLEFTRREAIDTRVFITPNHARLSRLEQRLGLQPQIEDWKRELTRRIAKQNARRSSAQAITLWDMSTPAPYAAEALPKPGSGAAPPRFFYDSGHFTPMLGRTILRVLTQQRSPSRALDCGGPLTPRTIEPMLANMRAQHAQYALQHPHDVAEIDVLISNTSRNAQQRD